MNRQQKKVIHWLWITSVCLSVFVMMQCRAGTLASSKEPVHIQLSLTDKTGVLYLYGRLILLPQERQAVLFFLNTDARQEPASAPFRNGIGIFAEPMQAITGKKQDYKMTLQVESLSRIIDLTDGLEFFVEDATVFDNGKYQYLEGVQLFSGSQSVEFLLHQGRFEKGSEYLSYIERLNRAESVLLNFLWQLPAKKDQIRPEYLDLIYSLIETDLQPEKFRELYNLFSDDNSFQVIVLTTPLELGAPVMGEKTLIFNTDRAKQGYNELLQSLQSKVDGFPIQVLNGTETNRLAGRVKELIHNRGVRVLATDNYRDTNFARTIAIEHSGDFRKAKLLMELLGLSRNQVFFRRRGLDLHASVILGKDFDVKSLLKNM